MSTIESKQTYDIEICFKYLLNFEINEIYIYNFKLCATSLITTVYRKKCIRNIFHFVIVINLPDFRISLTPLVCSQSSHNCGFMNWIYLDVYYWKFMGKYFRESSFPSPYLIIVITVYICSILVKIRIKYY